MPTGEAWSSCVWSRVQSNQRRVRDILADLEQRAAAAQKRLYLGLQDFGDLTGEMAGEMAGEVGAQSRLPSRLPRRIP